MSSSLRIGFRAAALLLLLALAPATWPASTPDCGSVCGFWQIDGDAATSTETLVDAALADYSGPRRPRRQRAPQTLEGADEAYLERSLGPIDERLPHAALRAELLRQLQTPGRLEIRQQGADVLLGSPDGPSRRFSPDVSHARVDGDGTAIIRCTLQARRLRITETYSRRHRNAEDYTVDRSGDVLTVVREVRRPGLAPVRLTVRYRRVENFGLESPTS